MPVIQALSASPENRDVRVHDCDFYTIWYGRCDEDIKKFFQPIIPVVIGVGSDINNFKSQVGVALTMLKGGKWPFWNSGSGQGLGEMGHACNGYIGRFIYEAIGKDCSRSLRSQIEAVYGTYIPDSDLYKFQRMTWDELAIRQHGITHQKGNQPQIDNYPKNRFEYEACMNDPRNLFHKLRCINPRAEYSTAF